MKILPPTVSASDSGMFLLTEVSRIHFFTMSLSLLSTSILEQDLFRIPSRFVQYQSLDLFNIIDLIYLSEPADLWLSSSSDSKQPCGWRLASRALVSSMSTAFGSSVLMGAVMPRFLVCELLGVGCHILTPLLMLSPETLKPQPAPHSLIDSVIQ